MIDVSLTPQANGVTSERNIDSPVFAIKWDKSHKDFLLITFRNKIQSILGNSNYFNYYI